MEGLIFTVYKALKKKNKAPKHYDCLLDEATQGKSSIDNKNDVVKSRDTSRSYNISDFYPDGYNYHYVLTSLPTTSSVGVFQEHSTSTRGRLKRYNSVKGYNYCPSSNSSSFTTSSATTKDDYIIAPKQMRRSWSHILFPLCVSSTKPNLPAN